MIDRRQFLGAAALLSACAKPAPEAKKYKLTGEVLRVDPNNQIAAIKGDKIEGWMEAMTMDYPVKDKSELARLQPGDRIQATVFVTESSYYIGGIQVVGKAAK